MIFLFSPSFPHHVHSFPRDFPISPRFSPEISPLVFPATWHLPGYPSAMCPAPSALQLHCPRSRPCRPPSCGVLSASVAKLKYDLCGNLKMAIEYHRIYGHRWYSCYHQWWDYGNGHRKSLFTELKMVFLHSKLFVYQRVYFPKMPKSWDTWNICWTSASFWGLLWGYLMAIQ